MLASRLVRAIHWLLAGLVIAVPLFYWKWSLYPYASAKTAVFEALVELIFALWVALAIVDKRYRPRMSPLAWAVAAYLAILTITAVAGVDPWRSFFSDLERAFGIVAYYHLAALALVVSSLSRTGDIPWKKLWYASFGTSLLTVAIALIQLGAPNILLAGDSAGGRPGATFGNPTFLAGYLLFNIFLAGYFLFRSRNKSGEKVLLWAAVIFGVAGIFITETRGDIFGLFAGIFALIILFAIHPPIRRSDSGPASRFEKRNFYVLLLVILVVAAGGVWFTRSSAAWSHVPGIDRLKNLTLSGSNSDIEPRLIASAAAWKGFLEKPLTGWGFENFNVVFNKYYDPKVLEYGYAESNFDKPHDIALEMLDAGGILLLLAYLGVLIALIYESWRLKDRFLGQFACAVVVAYFVRSLVIFDTIGPAFMLFLLIGWVDGQNAALAPHAGRQMVSSPILTTSLIAAAAVIYALNGTAFAAGYFDWEGHENLQLLNQPAAGVADFTEAAATWNIYQWDFIRDDVNTVAQAYFYDEQAVPQDAVKNAIMLMQQVAADHPGDAYNHYLLTDIYNLGYDIDPKNYGAQAEAQAQIALQLSPNRQEIYYYLMKTKSLEGDTAAALTLARQALELDPNVADSHFYYGMLAFATGDTATGYNEVETAIKIGRKWTDYHEPEVAADYFADSGHLSEAIGLYQAALSMEPNDVSAEMKLGAAYYLNGDDISAKKYLENATSKFNISSSPAYAQFQPILNALGIQ